MGGRGAASMSADYSRGSYVAEMLDVDENIAAKMYDAIQDWAHGSSSIKNAQRGFGEYSEKDIENARLLEEFISKSPQYTGEMLRVVNVPEGTEFPKNGKIYSDGSITSWTVPSNLENAMHGFGRESGLNVIYHVENATHGADIGKLSDIGYLDREILQSGGYDGSLTIIRTKKGKFKSWAYPEGMDVLHVYLKE